MKTKVLLAAVAVAFSFALTSCGNKKAADANASAGDSCCAAQTEQVCDSAKACCQADGSAACDSAKCDKACDKTACDKTACDKKECDKACDKK
ncbi:hypothetical protein [Bacteroides fluxus]|mgnify:FL=1|uniref:Lipoprotein n=1 Tax=Bacteroides fluxus YIT 12057 TaxID=763034 RepID=F3PN04_9BACE|nr:hypothetical protein [Bacteroides fluxus]EGF59796.1 hypothetical protein HMPREF9446_00090 [Bacteroides fluxus YIT 12057]MDY3789283.1 hypothetical protein [Bacteroides fluxus]